MDKAVQVLRASHHVSWSVRTKRELPCDPLLLQCLIKHGPGQVPLDLVALDEQLSYEGMLDWKCFCGRDQVLFSNKRCLPRTITHVCQAVVKWLLLATWQVCYTHICSPCHWCITPWLATNDDSSVAIFAMLEAHTRY
eukprot:gnl/TRDRNA2_/TRDRNA2_132973_c0_seq2.p1 gnl/TRDRNA2_/TRDRNA2_132973_c0~~gnl/TRDRNA2_/TRDRNA2_132973_c0_seq2.p1  ORF type:complete len:138 (-),score=7.33 gnl/TRDRNA2_/TRDRNA2_132973_c0_seq2:275-688(-)